MPPTRPTKPKKKVTKKPEKPRRPKGMGRVFQRGSKWYGRLRKKGEEILTDPYDTEEAAERALDRLAGTGIDPRFLPTLEEWWSRLLEPGGIWENRQDYQTCNLYDSVLHNAIVGRPLAKMRIDQIRRKDVQRHVDRLYKDYAESTVRRYGSCIHVVFAEAVEEGLIRAHMEAGEVIPANPADGVKFRKIPEAKSYIFEDAELALYPELLYRYNKRLSAMITVIADTGARPGEVCGMLAEDVKGDVWTVSGMMRRDGVRKPYAKGKKIRAVTLTPDALAAIESQGQGRGLVWLNEDGNKVRPDALGTHILRFRKSLEAKEKKLAAEEKREPVAIPPLHPRNLRKTFVTRGVETGNVKATQAAVGHSSSRTTLDVYAKARLNPQRDLVLTLGKSVQRGIFDDKGTDRGAEKQSPSKRKAR